MITRLLIANRGEIACRIIKTARRLGISTVAVYSDADADARHVALADEAHRIGPAPASESYLKGDEILRVAKETGAEAIHPGYGFLSENAAFAQAVETAGLIFVGPPASAITAMGLKDGAKRLMEKAGVPVVPGYHGDDQDPDHLAKEAGRIGYPVLIKAVAGGGGKGMRKVEAADAFADALKSARREAKAAFGDDRVLIEKFVTAPRHVEIQVFADAHGTVVHLFERDCSLQRRHQKVIEEAPAPGMTDEVRKAMGEAAVEAARAIGYRGAGTVEFIADGSKGLREDGFFFMEMNTRLQVEHPVTEMITGQDLVEWQLRVAAGEPLPLTQEALAIEGHAVEARLYAENPVNRFLPSTGTLHRLRLPEETEHVRVDTGVREGDTVTVHYDPMIAKLIVWDRDRASALRRLEGVMRAVQVAGVQTNAGFLAEIAASEAFRNADIDTGFIDRHLDALVPVSGEVPSEIKALAALYVLETRRQAPQRFAHGDPHSPWGALDGWRVGARASETVRFGGDESFEIGITHGEETVTLEIGGTRIEARGDLSEYGIVTAVLDGKRSQAGVLALKDRIVILHRGHAFEVTPHDPLAGAGAEAEGAATIAAPMPGKIISVHAAKGDQVKRGQPLVVLEAMKMEHTLSATRDAEVETIAVSPGDQVEEGAVVVTFASET